MHSWCALVGLCQCHRAATSYFLLIEKGLIMLKIMRVMFVAILGIVGYKRLDIPIRNVLTGLMGGLFFATGALAFIPGTYVGSGITATVDSTGVVSSITPISTTITGRDYLKTHVIAYSRIDSSITPYQTTVSTRQHFIIRGGLKIHDR